MPMTRLWNENVHRNGIVTVIFDSEYREDRDNWTRDWTQLQSGQG